MTRTMSATEIKADGWKKTLSGIVPANSLRALCEKCGVGVSGNPSREKMIENLEKDLKKKNNI